MKQLLFVLFLTSALISCKKDEQKPIEVLKACFEFNPNEINAGEVQFSNCSENATYFFWDFGDGQTSNEKEPLHLFEGNFPYYVTLIAYNGNESDTLTRPLYDNITVFKPNIYIHPLYKLDLCMRISFPLGGEIIESIPQYIEQWCVNVDTSGKIDNQYNYLFYESKQPNIFQYKTGWCIAKSGLELFFENNLKQYNFPNAEIKDFIEYWIPLLKENQYYLIYPQTNEIIDKVIQFDFSTNPDNINRLFYGIVGTDEYSEIEEPKIVPFKRNEFYIMEWGVFRK